MVSRGREIHMETFAFWMLKPPRSPGVACIAGQTIAGDRHRPAIRGRRAVSMEDASRHRTNAGSASRSFCGTAACEESIGAANTQHGGAFFGPGRRSTEEAEIGQNCKAGLQRGSRQMGQLPSCPSAENCAAPVAYVLPALAGRTNFADTGDSGAEMC